MFTFVDTLLKSANNVDEQIKVLKEYSDNEEVKLYLQYFENCDNLSPYMRWYLDKYLFDKKVPEEFVGNKKTNIKLFSLYSDEYEKTKKTYSITVNYKVGDWIIIKEGVYQYCDAELLYVNYDEMIVQLDLFGSKIIEKLPLSYIGGVRSGIPC